MILRRLCRSRARRWTEISLLLILIYRTESFAAVIPSTSVPFHGPPATLPLFALEIFSLDVCHVCIAPCLPTYLPLHLPPSRFTSGQHRTRRGIGKSTTRWHRVRMRRFCLSTLKHGCLHEQAEGECQANTSAHLKSNDEGRMRGDGRGGNGLIGILCL